jgi:hypothetical protein
MRKKRAVKEGSPFEEEYILELIRDETCLQPGDKDQVKMLMKSLMFFGLITESVVLHGLISKVIVAGYESAELLSVEQERLLQEHPQINASFSGKIGHDEKSAEAYKKELNEWEN